MRKHPLTKVTLGELKDSHFREFLGPISDEDVLALKEDSMDRYNDWWANLRVYPHENGHHLLFGHRRVRAAILKWGPDMPIMVTPVDVSDEEKIQFLGEAGWRNSTEDERLGLVKLASMFLIEYGEGNPIRVDIDWLKERVGSDSRYEGAKRISDWLGPRLWPRPRIQELLKPPKPREVLSEGMELLQGETHERVQTIIPAVNENQVGHVALEDDPTTPVNPASMPVCNVDSTKGGLMTPAQAAIFAETDAIASQYGLDVPTGRTKKAAVVYDQAFFERRRMDIEKMIKADLKRDVEQSLIDGYRQALKRFIDEITGRIVDQF